MRPERISFYVYAETPAKADQLQRDLHDFVVSMYDDGIIVTAELLSDALNRYKDNFFVRSFFRQRGH